MKKLSVNEIREKYLAFFEKKGHLRMKSFSLVPENDKSLLLINSGMAPLKPYFTGAVIPPKKRVTTCQKCIRTGDIENVGKTARHGTFFEMLGNFSFGDYFKKEATMFAYEFFIKELMLPKDKLYISIYKDDDETYDIWKDHVGIDENKIVRLGKEDNFWEHGVGPCGPCSEIYFDKGEEYGCDEPSCAVGCDCDRYMEVWNLVFTQFYKEEDGSYSKLDNPNIDTGMGLERIATVMQGVNSIFDIDTVRAVRDKVCSISGKKYGENAKFDISIRVITDHIKTVTFMTADGVLPSNEGRGYVLRRLLRRAIRHGKILGINGLFLKDISSVVINSSKGAYDELLEKEEYIYKILTVEEERFHKTIDNGMEILKEKIEVLKKNKKDILNGKDAFKLYDTFGFPFELMAEILEEDNIKIDEIEFKNQMEIQKKMARDAREEDTYLGADETIYHKLPADMKSEFIGYIDTNLKGSRVLSIVCGNSIVDEARAGDEICIITDKTPFYAEKGGQAGDKGTIYNDNVSIDIKDCTIFNNTKILHHGIIKKGSIKTSDIVDLCVSYDNRQDTARNHTATHLLHKALKDALGAHIEQAGSLVTKDRLRFDFTHFEPITKEELSNIEKIVNENILKSHEVIIKEMDIETAKKEGAIALFGEKYGDIVRVINIGGYSIELCGGTHLKNTASIGSFKIVSEGGISAGVRRIEAITGYNALKYYNEEQNLLIDICKMIKANKKDATKKISAILEENKNISKELESIKDKLSAGDTDNIIKEAKKLGKLNIILSKVKNSNNKALKKMCDNIKSKLDNYIVMLIAENDDDNKFDLVAMCSEEATKMGIKAGDIIRESAKLCDGSGGGNPSMAQGGGKDKQKIDKAIENAFSIIKEKI